MIVRGCGHLRHGAGARLEQSRSSAQGEATDDERERGRGGGDQQAEAGGVRMQAARRGVMRAQIGWGAGDGKQQRIGCNNDSRQLRQ